MYEIKGGYIVQHQACNVDRAHVSHPLSILPISRLVGQPVKSRQGGGKREKGSRRPKRTLQGRKREKKKERKRTRRDETRRGQDRPDRPDRPRTLTRQARPGTCCLQVEQFVEAHSSQHPPPSAKKNHLVLEHWCMRLAFRNFDVA